MSEPRTVTIFMDADTQSTMKELTHSRMWEEAIGYLSTWNMTFPRVRIYAESDTDMLAVYLDDEGNTAYALGAVWHHDHYGFHS